MSTSVPARRFAAISLLAALIASGVAEMGASLCTSETGVGMADTDMRMAMPGGAATMPDHENPSDEHGTRACPPTTDGAPPCPFALGGIGPCGTTAPAPASAMVDAEIPVERSFRLAEHVPVALTRTFSIPHPPPRPAV